MEKGRVRMYTCGPTVYNFAHIGNFRCYLFEDLLRRTIQFFGFKVDQAMNLTDIDDKTIKGALSKKISLEEYTKPYIEAFFEDLNALRIQRVEHYPAATDYIDEMIRLIQVLMEKGYAYLGGDGSIYYSIKKFSHYGCLSHLNMEELKAGASERVSADEYEKDHIADFVLWKKFDPERDGAVFWESPFGKGRPGWHLECSAMAMKLLGETIDIHAGGVDNMFPHHENEIAQSEACSGKTFAKVWMHCEHLIVDNKKMSKSLGNVYTLRDLLQRGYSGLQVRYMLLQTHYKTQLNFTFAGLESVKASLQRLNDFVLRMERIDEPGSNNEVDPILQKAYIAFAEALADDLNISPALAALFELVREIHGMADAGKVYREDAQKVIGLLKRFDSVLSIFTFDHVENDIPLELQEALENRQKARKEKDWALADSLRNFIISKGYVIEDTTSGARLKLKD